MKNLQYDFFAPCFFLKADMFLSTDFRVSQIGIFDFLLGGIERWVC